MTSVLVTGGAGFVGSHIVDRLLEEGYEVSVIDNLTSHVHTDKPDYLNDEAAYTWGDIRNSDQLVALLEEADILCHHAALVGVGRSMYDIETFVDANSRGTARLLDLIVSNEIELEKMIVASSMSIYGEGEYYCEECKESRHPGYREKDRVQNGHFEPLCPVCEGELDPKPTPETKPAQSDSIYAMTKRHQEEMVLRIGRAYDIPALALRYFNIYGPRQALDNPYTGVCAIFAGEIASGRAPVVFEDGHQLRDFVHVSDIAQANVAAIESEDVGNEVINIATGNPQSILDVADRLIELSGKDSKLSPKVTNEFRPGDIRHCYADISKAKELLDFEPSVAFEDGLSDLVEWAQDRDAESQADRAYGELLDKGLIEDI